MNQRVRAILSIAVFLLLLAAAGLLYSTLSKENAPDLLVVVGATHTPENEPLSTAKPTGSAKDTEKPAPSPTNQPIATPSPEPEDAPEAPETPGGEDAATATPEPTPYILPAPDFSMVDRDGNAVKLSDFFGKPIVLNFFASWCPPCKGEMPDFQKVYEELGTDVQFLMIDVVDGRRETLETGRAYIDEQGYTFPVYYDVRQEGAIAYGVVGIPMTLFIDSEGNIQTLARSALSEKLLRRGISFIHEAE